MDFSDPRQTQEFTNLFTGVAEYYEKTLSPAGLKVLMLGLQRFELTDLKRACSIHVQNPDNGQFMPKVADIVRIIDGDTGSQAGQAWVKADFALRTIGPYRDVCFDDPVIHRVIQDLGGWVKFVTGVDEKGYPFLQRDFEKRYQAYALRPTDEYPKLLTGIASHQNNLRGFVRRELPALVGDESKALQVYQNGKSEVKGISNRQANFARMIERMERSSQQPAVALEHSQKTSTEDVTDENLS